MDTLLNELQEEWKTTYLELSQLQKQDEETDKPKDKKVPRRIDALEVLKRIRQNRFEALHGPFEKAAEPIRDQLRQELQHLGGNEDGR
jgi:hypothetical protein